MIPTSLYEYPVDPHSATWGKVTPVTESDTLVSLMRDVAGPLLNTSRGRKAYEVSYILTYLNNAQQAIVMESPDGKRSSKSAGNASTGRSFPRFCGQNRCSDWPEF